MNSPDPASVEQLELRIVAAAAKGDRGAQRELFERYREAAYVVAFRITGRQEDALDVVQDAFIKAFERLAEFAGDASFKTWLLRIASNRSLDLLRARKVRLAASLDQGDEDGGGPEPMADDEPELTPGAELEQRELAARVQAAVDRLPADQRSVFAMYAAGEMTYGDIATALGVPIGTVMSRLFHARKKLAEMLGDLAPRGSG
ncbi:MAG: RNA polymerase sigma factor [Phycisphaerae bacterium]